VALESESAKLGMGLLEFYPKSEFIESLCLAPFSVAGFSMIVCCLHFGCLKVEEWVIPVFFVSIDYIKSIVNRLTKTKGEILSVSYCVSTVGRFKRIHEFGVEYFLFLKKDSGILLTDL
jgi:hypothetical protein